MTVFAPSGIYKENRGGKVTQMSDGDTSNNAQIHQLI